VDAGKGKGAGVLSLEGFIDLKKSPFAAQNIFSTIPVFTSPRILSEKIIIGAQSSFSICSVISVSNVETSSDQYGTAKVLRFSMR